MVQASLVPSKEPPETVEGAEGERGIGKREMGLEGMVGGVPHLPMFSTLFLAGISCLYYPSPDNYRVPVPL